MKNKLLIQIFFYCFIAIMVYPPDAVSTTNLKTSPPLQLVQVLTQQFEEELLIHQDEIKADPLLTYKIMARVLDSHVNFMLMSRYVLGKNWKKASTQQQQEFTILFKSLLTKFYSKAFNNYLKNNRFEKGMITFLPYREKQNSKYAKVKTEIKLNSGAARLKVQYSLYKAKTKGWKIYDLSIEGISLVTSYRSSFKQIIKKEKMSGLIQHLKNKLQQKQG